MGQHDVDVAVAAILKSFAGSDRDPLDLDAGILKKNGSEIIKQSGVVRAGGGRHPKHGGLCRRERAEGKQADDEKQRDNGAFPVDTHG